MDSIKKFFDKEVLGHPLVLAAIGAVVVIALASGVYYISATRTPATSWGTASVGSIEQVVVGTGTVAPAQNPDLAFQSGGRVAAVNVAVGQNVGVGEVLASLDTASLNAALSQAKAALASQKAKLDAMQAGALQTDVDAKKTAVAQAQQVLTNLYSSVPAAIENAYQATYSGLHTNTDTLFSNPDSQNPTLLFQTTDSQASTNVTSGRTVLKNALVAWQPEAATLAAPGAAPSPADLDTALGYSLEQLKIAQTFDGYLLEALGASIPSNNFTQSQLGAARVAAGTLSGSINNLITSLQQTQQQIASAKIGVQSATDSLNQTLAGSTSQDIEAAQAAVAGAEAGVESAQALLGNAIVVAPFSGTVSSVAVKSGQVVAPNTTAVSLTPHSALQVEVYVSEVDAAVLKSGQAAEVTLDAYGTGRLFPATVVSVDRSPSGSGNTVGYKVTLQFAENDSAIALGMGANVSIVAAQKNNVVIVPISAVIQNGNQDFVLVKTTAGTVQRPVTIGLVSSDGTTEVVSGINVGDTLANF